MPENNAKGTMTDEELIARCRLCSFRELDRNLMPLRPGATMAATVLCLDSGRSIPDPDLARLAELWETKRHELWPEAQQFLVMKPGTAFLELAPAVL